MKKLLYIATLLTFIIIKVSCNSNDALIEHRDTYVPNLVDERFELVSLIFRLAGQPPYTQMEILP